MSAYRELALFINGEWEVSTSGSLLPVVNPATGEAIGSLPVATIEQIDSAVKSASRAFAEWRRAPATERRNVLRRAAEILREKAETVAYRLTLEQGKPVAQARLEVTRVCDIFEYYAEEATRLCERSFPARPDGIQHQLVPEPVGVIAAFTAWNFPLVLAGRKLAMALAAGCSVVLKASEETPASAMALVEALDDAGLPKGVVNLLFGRPAEIAERLIGAPEVRKISLTGSIRVGKQIAENAGRYLKPCSLELGGHCPVLIFPDVDIEDTVDKLVSAKFANAGQICTSPSRFMIHADIYDRFVDVFLRRTEQLQLGNGIDCVTQVGPLANERGLRSIEEYVDSARRAGARILCGGAKADRPGYFYRPTVMVDLPSDARVMQEEYFGPLAPMVRFKHEDEAVKLANSLPYGLAAYVFTRDEVRSKRLVQSIEAGGVFINTAVTLSEYTPFCGVKESGYGYEGGREGLETFVHYKLVNRVTCDG
ncbi:MAG: NAD-dependent succinate-semialdehyde dehydrogenase [Rhizobiales bacterium]|jgi:succinate-semialdehyde dehydrogenase/glutarate-semialdehyde dehydrogenase|nr:NAD-dependent succinate-semialdehyde dehydrogenase [Hyphomicrobiales bacterium]CAH1692534.1 Alpha-ketoglutaric semialdehyde dehydrogenase 1 [Hyphomicrobiales bacterium]CAH1702648.1 Alpha-ketoglutaric semialdehyde dehydrogenase 1 [Hyphomicrobiales bacterium]CAI0346837.1 Alpha-ketoglutaric semialdehyde dehydrogenase 1 [Hyphomicrobiales bacterium]